MEKQPTIYFTKADDNTDEITAFADADGLPAVRVEKLSDFLISQIFDCGQCFRWEREADGSYTGTAMGRIVNMRFEPEGRLTVDNCTEEEFMQIWTPHLDLERDYAKIKRGLKGEQIQKAVEYGYGIRILKQDFWETLLSFIISQNNNIPRIKGCIEALARCCGEKIGTMIHQ